MTPDLNGKMALCLLMASFLGGLIGLEREVHGRPAGFRTHLLVSLGSCLFVLASLYIYRMYGDFSGRGPVGIDPARIAAQVVTGIGFLGAGAIIREKAAVRGLTTAACLWVAAAIGLACGVGMFLTAIAVTALSLGSLLLLKRVEKILSRDSYASIKIWSREIPGQKERMERLLLDCALQVVSISVEKNVDTGEVILEFDVRYKTHGYAANLIDKIASTEGVKRVRID